MSIDCRVLGSLSVLVDGARIPLGSPQQRLLLAVLLSRANSVVRVDELIDVLWHHDPPRTARKTVQVYVCALRKIFGDRLAWSGHGYRLRMDPAECDVLRFDELVGLGRRALQDGDPPRALELLARGVELWQGLPLMDFADEESLTGEVERLMDRLLTALEDWAELQLDRGGHGGVVERLQGLAERYPLRQRLAAVWMRGLARVGRVAAALEHYELVRRVLASELGIDPGPMLTQLHQRLLSGAETGRAPGSGEAFQHVTRDLPDFVGRTVQTRVVVDTLLDERGSDLVLVCGPVGIGKTAFAVHVAHLVRRAFPDGVIMVELATAGEPRSLHAVLTELLDLAGLDAGPRHAVPRALSMWRAWLAERRLLLILDGAPRESVVKALLPGAGPSRVIVTSGSRLSGVESVCRIELPALTDAERIELLGRIIGRDRVLGDRQAARRIAACCAGLPLALRITGAKLAAMRHVRLRDHADRLSRSSSLLAEMAFGELGVRDRYECFYRTLTDLQREAYRRLAELPAPPLDHEQVLTALAGCGGSADSALESLVECTLLSVPDCEVDARCATYWMSAFAYLFGRETVAAAGLSEGQPAVC